MSETYLCRRCGRKLKNKNAIKLGFGTICYKKYIKSHTNYLFEFDYKGGELGGSKEN